MPELRTHQCSASDGNTVNDITYVTSTSTITITITSSEELAGGNSNKSECLPCSYDGIKFESCEPEPEAEPEPEPESEAEPEPEPEPDYFYGIKVTKVNNVNSSDETFQDKFDDPLTNFQSWVTTDVHNQRQLHNNLL